MLPETCGWALRSEGTPWVAQRVWAMPVVAWVLGRGGFEFGDAADRADAFDAGSADDGEAGRVIAAVFELLQAFDEDGDDVACRLLPRRCRT